MAGIPWTQFMGRGMSAISGTFAQDNTRVVHTFIVDRDKVPDMVRGLVGYSVKNNDLGAGFLSRWLPFQCPQFPYLYAKEVTSMEPLGWDRVTNQPIRGPYGPIAPVKYYKLTVVFAALPYDVFPDDHIILQDAEFGEQCRYMQWKDDGTVQILKRESGSMAWDSDATVPAYARGQQLTMPVGMPVPRVKQTWTWTNLPDDGLFTNGGRSKGGTPGTSNTKGLLYAQGCVNDATFMGFATGTLLFDSYSTTPHIQPVDPTWYSALNGNNWPPTQAVRSWDVTLNFIWYDPNPFYTLGGSAYVYHGHNLLPHPDGNFYKVFQVASTNPITLSAASLYMEADFTKIFLMN